MSYWFWDDFESMSYWFVPHETASDYGLIYFSEPKIPFLFEFDKNFEKSNNYMRKSCKKSFKSDTSVGTTPLPSGTIIEEKIDGLSNENNTAQPTKKLTRLPKNKIKSLLKFHGF